MQSSTEEHNVNADTEFIAHAKEDIEFLLGLLNKENDKMKKKTYNISEVLDIIKKYHELIFETEEKIKGNESIRIYIDKHGNLISTGNIFLECLNGTSKYIPEYIAKCHWILINSNENNIFYDLDKALIN